MVPMGSGGLVMSPCPFQSSPSRSSQPRRGPAPLVCVPCPQALATLHELLQLRKLRVVDVFRKAGMAGRKIKRQDFIRVIREVRSELLLCT